MSGAASVFWTRRIISSSTDSLSSFLRLSNTAIDKVTVSSRHVTASLRTLAIWSLSLEMTLLRRRAVELDPGAARDRLDVSACCSISRTALDRWLRNKSRASFSVRLSSRMMARIVSDRV
jgi:hypothetical protein